LRILKLLIARNGSTGTDGTLLDNVARAAIEFRQFDFDYVLAVHDFDKVGD
jgi:hypothetical protein